MRASGLLCAALWLSACAMDAQSDAVLASSPDRASALPDDPAVAHANELAEDGSPYRQGVSGFGDDLIHYVEAGSGPTVLFVHGFPSFWYVWRDQMEALRHCRRVIAIDAPGAGLSAKPEADDAYRVEKLAKRLHALIEELSPDEKVTLVGHDWGGALAWSYAQWDASKLDRLAVFSAPPYNLLLDLLARDEAQRDASQYMPRLLRIEREMIETQATARSFYDLAYKQMVDQHVLSEREGQLFQQALGREHALYAGIQWYKANVPEFDNLEPSAHYWPRRGAEVNIPILLIRGSEDRTFIKRMEDLAKIDAPQLKVVTLEEVGHWTPFQNPEPAVEHLMDFVLDEGEGCTQT